MSRRKTMARHVKEYLQQRRSLGFELRSQGELLQKFAEYFDRSGRRGPITTEVIMRWVNLPQASSRNYRSRRLSAVRCFARYLAARDGRTEVPSRRLVAKASFHQRPHLYSQRDLEQLLAATGLLWPTYPLKRFTFEMLFGLLACTGLRVSEALKLTVEQVDLDRGVLRIEKTKFKKSRLVPLHPTTTNVLRRYVATRSGREALRNDSAFFADGDGNRLTYHAVCRVFQKLRDILGWKQGNGEWPRPRIHDLRHTFACQRLLRWYRQGKNVHNLVMSLSTYLGHGKVSDTYWYLTGTPELLAIAGGRFERFAHPREGRRS